MFPLLILKGKCQIQVEDTVKFSGLLRKHELYLSKTIICGDNNFAGISSDRIPTKKHSCRVGINHFLNHNSHRSWNISQNWLRCQKFRNFRIKPQNPSFQSFDVMIWRKVSNFFCFDKIYWALTSAAHSAFCGPAFQHLSFNSAQGRWAGLSCCK